MNKTVRFFIALAALLGMLTEQVFTASHRSFVPRLDNGRVASTVNFSTYFGGGLIDQPDTIATDARGNVYIAGVTYSPEFLAFRDLSSGFLLKLSPQGKLIYQRTLGGTFNDSISGIAVDQQENVYLTGYSNSPDFPILNGAQEKLAGLGDGFVTVIDKTGREILWSTFLGGSSVDDPRAISLAPNGEITVIGVTTSVDYPVVNPIQARNGGKRDAFITTFNPRGQIIFSTYLGGAGDDNVGFGGVLKHDEESIYLSGATSSSNFPTKNPLQLNLKGAFDPFIVKINRRDFTLAFASYVGGGSDDDGSSGIAIDSQHRIWITGGTRSVDLPVTASAFQGKSNDAVAGIGDAFLAQVSSDGSQLLYSSYFGSSGVEGATSICLDLADNIYIAGQITKTGLVSAPSNFPLAQPIQSQYGGGFYDAFISKFSADGKSLLFSTFLGGADADFASAIVVDLSRNILVAGATSSENFPVQSAAQLRLGGGPDAFVISIQDALIEHPLTCVSAASYASDGKLAGDSIATAFGSSIADSSFAATRLPLPISVNGVNAVVTDSQGWSWPAPLFSISPGQVNLHFPPSLAGGKAIATIYRGDKDKYVCDVEITPVSPGLFSANATGNGVAAGVVLRIKADGTSGYEPLSRFDTGQNRFVTVPIDLGSENEQVFVVLFGTGLRGRNSLSGGVTASLGGVNAEVLYAGPVADFVGLDQANVRVPPSLRGRGDTVLNLLVDGLAANAVTMSFK